MHADLVAEQRLDPAPRHDRAPSDQQARAGHHHPRGYVVADLDARIEGGALCAIVFDHPAGHCGQLRAVDAPFRRPFPGQIAPAGGRQQDFFGDAQELWSHRTVKDARGLPEPGGIAQFKQGELQVELLLLFPVDEG